MKGCLMQTQDITMGKKSSCKLASVSCYAVEYQIVSDVIEEHGYPTARKFSRALHYIWNACLTVGKCTEPICHPYMMENRDTTQTGKTVQFPGMKIVKLETLYLLEQQPNGVK